MAVRSLTLPFQGYDDHDAFQLDQDHASDFRNVRSNRLRVTRSPGGTLLAGTPSPTVNPGFGFRQGSFTSPNGASSVTVTHNLGATPVALIVYASCAKSAGSAPDASTCIGMTDGTTTRVATIMGVNNRGPGAQAIAQENTNLIQVRSFSSNAAGNGLIQATFTSMNSTTFVVNFTTVQNLICTVNYVIIGGAGMSAALIPWTLSAATGNQAVTGSGFTPVCVLHAYADATASGLGGSVWEQLGFGAMTTAAQFGQGFYILQAFASSPPTPGFASVESSRQLTTAAITDGIDGTRFNAKYVSMDGNGFTVNKTVAAQTLSVFSLCLGGTISAKVGTFNKTTGSAPIQQPVTGVGFAPQGVILSSIGQAAANGAAVLNIGAFDGTNQGATSMVEQNSRNPSVATSDSQAASAYVALNETPASPSTSVKDQATQYSMDADGWTLAWGTNSATADQICYIALAAGSGTTTVVGIPRTYAQVYVGAAATAEKILMLTSQSAFIYSPVTASTGTFTPTAESYGSIATFRRFSVVNTQGITAWSHGGALLRQWDGTTFGNLVTTGTNHGARAGLIAFADRIVSIGCVVGGVVYSTQIRWSQSGNVNNWSGAGSGVLEIIETSQDPLVCGFVLGNQAFLAKNREIIELIWTGSQSPVFGTQSVVRGMGVLAPWSVALGEQQAFWLGPDNVYMFDGSNLQAVGDKVYNTIDPLIDYSNIEQIQGTVYLPGRLYILVVPPYKFVYDYYNDIWYIEDTSNFQAIGNMNVGTLFTANIGRSAFTVIGDNQANTVRMDENATSYLGQPIDSYLCTRDYTASELKKSDLVDQFLVSLWDVGSIREVRFQGVPNTLVEVAVSIDRGQTWIIGTNQNGQQMPVTVNSYGIGVAWFQQPFSQVRFRFRNFGTDQYEVHGSWAFDYENAGYLYPTTAS